MRRPKRSLLQLRLRKNLHQFVELGTLLFGITRRDRLFDAAGRMGFQDLRLNLG